MNDESHPGQKVSQRVILVVDDALDTLRMLCDALAAEGYAVLAARDAEEALQRFDLTVPDGVLLDAVMPGMDGFALCRRLKATRPGREAVDVAGVGVVVLAGPGRVAGGSPRALRWLEAPFAAVPAPADA